MSGMRFSRSLFCAFLVASITTSAAATTLRSLYEVEFSVSDQSAQERLDALRSGLHTVLLRTTGLRSLPSSRLIDEAFSNLDAYQLQFRYEDTNLAPNAELGTRLIISYDENAIQALIRSAELPVWSAQRPYVLFIISGLEGQRRTVQSSTASSEILPVLREAAMHRGLSYSLPLMDFDDRVILRDGALAFGFVTSVDALKRRVQADLVTSARIDRLAFGQHRVWLTIYDATGTKSQLFDVANLNVAAAEVVHRTADYLANRYAVTGSEVSALRLTISGISDIVGYRDAIAYFEKWEFIDRVLITKVEYGKIGFELHTASTWDQLEVYLIEDGLLVEKQVVSPDFDQDPEFVWHGPK